MYSYDSIGTCIMHYIYVEAIKWYSVNSIRFNNNNYYYYVKYLISSIYYK